MYPATAVPTHSLNTVDRIAFYKSVREKRKQLQLNQQNNGKESRSSTTENTFLTQMLQSSSSPSIPSSSSNTSSLSISSILRKGDLQSSSSSSSSSHRSVTGTLTNILPALLNGTLPSPRSTSPSDPPIHLSNLTSPRETTRNPITTNDESKCSTSVPVSPTLHEEKKSPHSQSNGTIHSSSPTRCRSYPISCGTTSTVCPISPVVSSASSCPSLTIGMTKTTSPSPDHDIPIKIVRSASVKSCASDSGVSSSSPLSDNNIVHVFRSNHHHHEMIHPLPNSNGAASSRKRKSLAHFYDELNKDKKFSTEATVSSTFPMSTTSTSSNTNIPYSQSEAIALGYAQYALMQTLTQQFRVNYPAAFLHAAAAAAATGYLPLSSSMMATTSTNGIKTSTNDDFRLRRKPTPESDDNNNHIRVSSSINDQPYRRETYQTLLESSQILRPSTSQRPIPMDLRKSFDTSPIPSKSRYSSSSSSTSPVGSPPCQSPPKSISNDPNNEFVCIPKKLMPVIGARINDWLERNLTFVFSLSTIEENLVDNRDKLLLLSHLWHRLVLISMIENSFEIYVTKDLQINAIDSTSSSNNSNSNNVNNPNLPTENDVKQIESLISRGKTLDIDEIGFNLIREVIIYKEGKTLLENPMADAFDKAECQAQARLTSWCGSRVKYSKIVFFICNIYQVKQDIFERLFCASSMHQTTPIQSSFERFLSSTKNNNEL